MLAIFAHAGHMEEMNMGDMTYVEHCMPIIVGCGIIIAMLITVIVYLLVAWQPKSATKSKSKR